MKRERSSTPLPLESSLIWKQGTGPTTTGSVLVKLAQNGFFQEVNKIISLSKTASLVGRDSDGGLPELWDIMGQRRCYDGITRLMAVCIVGGKDSPGRALALIRDHNADVKEKDDLGRNALHHALGARPFLKGKFNDMPINMELVQALISIYPEGLLQKDNNGSLPIHLVCFRNTPSVELIKLIMEAHPGGAFMSDKMTSYPLHLICAKKASSFEIIKYIFDKNPNAACHQGGEYDNFPLHSACFHNAPVALIKLLYNAFPRAVQARNSRFTQGDLPLHLSCNCKAPLEVIKYLYDLYPEGIKMGGKYDVLPLVFACRSNAPIETVQFLLSKYPQAAASVDGDETSPLSWACANGAFDVIRLLLKACPDAVRTKNGIGKTNRWWAERAGAPDDIIALVTIPGQESDDSS